MKYLKAISSLWNLNNNGTYRDHAAEAQEKKLTDQLQAAKTPEEVAQISLLGKVMLNDDSAQRLEAVHKAKEIAFSKQFSDSLSHISTLSTQIYSNFEKETEKASSIDEVLVLAGAAKAELYTEIQKHSQNKRANASSNPYYEDLQKKVDTLTKEKMRTFAHVKNKQGETSLHTVAAAGNQNHALRLILAGAEVNQPNSRGSTPLHHAAVSNRFHMANTLANAGANVKTKNKDGLSAFGIFSIKYGKENARRIFADGNAPSFGQDKPTLKLGR